MSKCQSTRLMNVALGALAAMFLVTHAIAATQLEHVRVSDDGLGFVLDPSGRPFTPWGFNYDHDRDGRLIEDYWHDEWPTVVEDFREMKALGANIVRIHLQFGKFMPKRGQQDERQIGRLDALIKLAETSGLYLDLTGLGCYHKQDVPVWYDELSAHERWAAQAEFWEAIARRTADSPAIFCYDLMNEPVVAAGKRPRNDWLGKPFGDGKHFVQFITLVPEQNDRPAVARAWIGELTEAIRRHDRRHMITVGLVDWSLDRPGLRSGFVPERIVDDVDFISVHVYPRRDKVHESLDRLRGFAVGKPVVIEETFPLYAGREQFAEFFEASKSTATGWIGFYWGKTPDECRRSKTIADAIMFEWFEFFERNVPAEGR